MSGEDSETKRERVGGGGGSGYLLNVKHECSTSLCRWATLFPSLRSLWGLPD